MIPLTFDDALQRSLRSLNRAASRAAQPALAWCDVIPVVVASYALGHICPTCGRPLTASNATFDHHDPLGRGGAHAPTNVRILCRRCNQFKRSLMGAEWEAMTEALRNVGLLDALFLLYRPAPRRLATFDTITNVRERTAP